MAMVNPNLLAGKTVEAVRNAPKGALFIVGHDSPSSMRRLARFLKRQDLTFIKSRVLTPEALGDTFRELVIDHSVPPEHREVCFNWVKERYMA